MFRAQNFKSFAVGLTLRVVIVAEHRVTVNLCLVDGTKGRLALVLVKKEQNRQCV